MEATLISKNIQTLLFYTESYRGRIRIFKAAKYTPNIENSIQDDLRAFYDMLVISYVIKKFTKNLHFIKLIN